ncbi:Pollen receptor-like kinase 1 [Linum perenne]
MPVSLGMTSSTPRTRSSASASRTSACLARSTSTPSSTSPASECSASLTIPSPVISPSSTVSATLRDVYLARNNFSSKILPDFFLKMVVLKKLWLAENEFSGMVPTSLIVVSNLVELHLENNQFLGHIPDLELHKLQEFDVPNNNLIGEIPEELAKFKSTRLTGVHDT